MTNTDKAAILRADIAERIEEAADTLRRVPDREREMLRAGERGAAWPLMLHTADEHAAWERVPVKRPPPSKEQITRMEEVIDWLLVLARQERKYFNAVWLFCAKRKKPSEAGKLLGCHRETATIWRDAGLDRIARHLSVTSPESVALRDKLMQGMHHPKRLAG